MKVFIILLFLNIGIITAQEFEKYSHSRTYAEKQLEIALLNNADRNRMTEKLFPTEEIAVKYAELVLFKKFGEELIEFEKPYRIFFIDDYWIIMGTLPKGYKGGVFHIIFDSVNGQVKRIYHTK